MTTRRNRLSGGTLVFFAGVAAIAAAGLYVGPLGATETARRPAAQPALQCGIETRVTGRDTTFQPWVQGHDDIVGKYRFELAGAGAEIDQAGDFEAGSDRPLTLGAATLSGPPDRYDIRLTVTVGSTRYVCPAGNEEI